MSPNILLLYIHVSLYYGEYEVVIRHLSTRGILQLCRTNFSPAKSPIFISISLLNPWEESGDDSFFIEYTTVYAHRVSCGQLGRT